MLQSTPEYPRVPQSTPEYSGCDCCRPCAPRFRHAHKVRDRPTLVACLHVPPLCARALELQPGDPAACERLAAVLAVTAAHVST